LNILHSEIAEILDIDTRVRLFMKVKLVFRVFGKQVTNFFVIDFKI